MNFILTDIENRTQFLPFTHTRSVGDIRCGILTMREKWEWYLKSKAQIQTVTYLQEMYEPISFGAQNYFINPAVFPTDYLVNEILALANNTCLNANGEWIACCLDESKANSFDAGIRASCQQVESQYEVVRLKQLSDIFSLNDMAIRSDYPILTMDASSASIDKTNTIIGEDLFIAEGAQVKASIINCSKGPVYIGKGAEIMEGCIIRGPLALGDGAQLKMGAKIYGATTIGPGCKVGGEVNNSVFFANSSKAHDGYIGNSVIGEWCNIGADSNNSNLKNNYEEVKLWSEANQKFEKTGLQFCGLMLADHSKCGINTMFNTGTVIGVSCNIFGSGFPRNYVPSFSWGGASGFTEYNIEKALQTMRMVFARRNKELTAKEENLYRYLFTFTQSQRNY